MTRTLLFARPTPNFYHAGSQDNRETGQNVITPGKIIRSHIPVGQMSFPRHLASVVRRGRYLILTKIFSSETTGPNLPTFGHNYYWGI